MLVAAGVDAVRPGVCKAVQSWVAAGGTLVIVGETMGLNEYGAPAPDAFPGIPTGARKDSETAVIEIDGTKLQAACWRDTRLDDSWELLASIGRQPAVWRKRFGKGFVWFANAKLPGDSIGVLVTLAGKEVGVAPFCETADALDPAGAPLSGIEVTPARRGDLEAWIVTPRTMGTKVVRFRPAAPAAPGTVMLRVWNRPDGAGMASYRQVIEPDADGSYVLPAGDRSILVRGPEAALRKRYGGPRAAWLPPLAAAEALAAGKARVDEEKAKRAAAKPAFAVDPDKVHPLDLRPFANRRFVDKVAGDGKDGWTDQGAQMSLQDTPWGVTICNGVPMEFIRYDQNDYRDCIVMKSTRLKDAPAGERPYPEKIEGVRVDRKAGAVYFLHAIAWGVLNKVETAFTYVVRYGDGTVEEVPVRNYREVWDWGFLALTAEMEANHCVKGWANGENKGLYLWRWTNPHPEKAIATIDIVSACAGQIPLIAAISVEDPGTPAVALDANPHALVALGGSAGVKTTVTNGVWKVALDESAGSWCTASCDIRPGIPYEKGAFGRLVFEVNRLPDAWGAYHDHATPQFKLNGRNREGKLAFGNWRVAKYVSNDSWFYRTDSDPDTWQTVYLSVPELAGGDWSRIVSIALQFQQMPTEHSGLEFRNFRFERSELP